jgi:hypothetical protein
MLSDVWCISKRVCCVAASRGGAVKLLMVQYFTAYQIRYHYNVVCRCIYVSIVVGIYVYVYKCTYAYVSICMYTLIIFI